MYSYSDTTEGKTYARVPDGTGGWVDPVPTPGGKNTKSNDLDDFQKYYEEFCFDKKDKPTCDKEFMEKMGILNTEASNPTVEDADDATNAETANDNESESSDGVADEIENPSTDLSDQPVGAPAIETRSDGYGSNSAGCSG